LNGLELNGRQIARALGLSPKPLNRTLADLTAEGLLIQRNVGSAYLFRANLDNPLVSDILVPLFQKERNLLRDALDEVLDGLKERIFTAILYGSVSRGEDRPSSDVDLMIVTDQVEEVEEVLEEQAVTFLERYGNILSAQVISPDELRRRYWDGDDFRLFQENNYPTMLSPDCQIRRISGQWAWIWQSKPSGLGQSKFWNSLIREVLADGRVIAGRSPWELIHCGA